MIILCDIIKNNNNLHPFVRAIESCFYDSLIIRAFTVFFAFLYGRF